MNTIRKIIPTIMMMAMFAGSVSAMQSSHGGCPERQQPILHQFTGAQQDSYVSSPLNDQMFNNLWGGQKSQKQMLELEYELKQEKEKLNLWHKFDSTSDELSQRNILVKLGCKTPQMQQLYLSKGADAVVADNRVREIIFQGGFNVSKLVKLIQNKAIDELMEILKLPMEGDRLIAISRKLNDLKIKNVSSEVLNGLRNSVTLESYLKEITAALPTE